MSRPIPALLATFCLFSIQYTLVTYAVVDATEHDFSFHGYARGGFMTSEAGETAAEFAAPGAGAKYRLGNESDVQLRLRLNYQYGDVATTEPYVQAEIAVEDYQRLGNSRDFTLNQVPKAWLRFGNVLADDVSFWVGRRWYKRKGSYINDYWWLNSGQKSNLGLGVEGIKLANSELNIAVFQHRDDDAISLNSANNNTGTLKAMTLDIRLEKMVISETSQLNFWGLYADRSKHENLGYEQQSGWGLGSWLDLTDVMGGINTLAVTYREGAAMHQSTYNAEPIRESSGYDLDNASQWEINNSWLWDDRSNYAVQWLLLARAENYGENGVDGDTIYWYSTGARPTLYLSQRWNVAAEFGIDYVDNEILGVQGSVEKISFALQLSPDKKFMSRPVLRFFMTYAQWSDDLVGYVGNRPDNAPYGNDNDGWTIGTQIEHIW
ncbi:carbohydrate porin [Oceanicoccus sp. KOV_DT_Chl]|uniref:carbohydrate porin n=1 Tax=Oceanicoccus sp. KOV_DT_Chl TaxID=1904639 RepID=UPI000C7AC82A|nr:carbohydrate porin [Oceanicoccus sp. KOV_DT_Chl]